MPQFNSKSSRESADWLLEESKKTTLSYSATELKNKTGEILEQVLRGNTVLLYKHVRAIAEIHPV